MRLDTALQGIKVVETASVLAGPSVGMFLAELGAEVIKIEHRASGGDMTRSWKTGGEDSETSVSAYFSAINYGKQYLDRNLKKPDQLQDVRSMISQADIFINNMKAESAKRFGLDQESLRQVNPRLIHAELSGFAGANEKVGFDIVLQAETGFLSMTGIGDEAAKLPVALIDILAAHQMKEGILLALYLRERDGKGSHIQCSLEESSLASLANQATNYLMNGLVAQRMGSLHPNIAPYGEVIKTSDGDSYVLAIGTDKQFEALCQILGVSDLPEDEHYRSNQDRLKHRTTLAQLLSAAASKLSGDYLEQHCIQNKVPLGKIRSLDEVLSGDTAQEMILEEEIEGQLTRRLKSVCFHMAR